MCSCILSPSGELITRPCGACTSRPRTPNSALRYYPNGRGDIDEETRRYEMVRFCSFVGFKPPYLYNRSLIDRLHRAKMPALVVWGEKDGLVPLAHGRAYAQNLPGSGDLSIVNGRRSCGARRGGRRDRRSGRSFPEG